MSRCNLVVLFYIWCCCPNQTGLEHISVHLQSAAVFTVKSIQRIRVGFQSRCIPEIQNACCIPFQIFRCCRFRVLNLQEHDRLFGNAQIGGIFCRLFSGKLTLLFGAFNVMIIINVKGNNSACLFVKKIHFFFCKAIIPRNISDPKYGMCLVSLCPFK